MALTEPSFISRDIAAITSEMVASYEASTGRTLQPAQVERVLIDLIAYRESLLRIGIQEAAKQCLVAYATYPMLDYLGELVGATRLAAAYAKTTLRFTLVSAQAVAVTVPAGTRVETKDGQVVFVTDADLIIPAGSVTGDVTATATTVGIAGNGYAAGEVNNLLDAVAYVASASNTIITSSGSAAESDDSFRERVKMAPEAFSNAGSKGAYEYWTKSAHSDISAAGVVRASAGVVNVYPLLSTGNPDATMIALVESVLTADKVRPLTDDVNVIAPTKVDFSITCALTLYATADSDEVSAAVETALEAYAATLRSGLGKDIVTNQVIAAANGVTGVYKAAITLKDSANATFTDKTLAENEWSNCTAITVSVSGAVNG